MKIEVGKYYRTRDGRKAFCSSIDEIINVVDYRIDEDHYIRSVFADTGRGNLPSEADHEHDRIAEWIDESSPTNPFLKTVTETRIVNGSHVFESSGAAVDVNQLPFGVEIITDSIYDKQSLAELARILNVI